MLVTCFVIQRFDGGVYDRRYRETFAPAIEAGGAKPVRADEVLGTTPVIEKIEAGLRNATIAFADVSEDNPNVFLELGFALSLNVPTVIACDKSKRTKLPFDISHRPVIFYSTEAQSDFDKMSLDIRENVKVAISEATTRGFKGNTDIEISQSVEQEDDVKRACLMELLDQDLRDPHGSTLWALQKKVVSPGINERMVSLAISKLIADGLAEKNELYDRESEEQYVAVRLTEQGHKLLLRSYATLMKNEQAGFTSGRFSDDDVPF